MEGFKIGDKVYMEVELGKLGGGRLKGRIVNIISFKLDVYNKLDYSFENSSWCNDDIAIIQLDGTNLTIKIPVKKITKIGNNEDLRKKEDIKDSLQFKTIGVKRDGQSKILWNRIDNLNLEFTVVGRVNVITAIKVLIKHLDLKEFTYERVCPYKITHKYPRKNEGRNHIFNIRWVDFDGGIKSQEILRTDDSLSLENCTCKVFIPDLLELARERKIVSLEDNTYKANESKLSGVCNEFEPISKIDRDMFEKQGWKVPKSFEKRFMSYKRF